jgi:hypothetical protein
MEWMKFNMAKKNEKNRKKHERRRIEHNTHLKELAAIKKFRLSTYRILHAMGIPDIFKMIHEFDVRFYYFSRFGTVRLIPEKGIKVPCRILTSMRGLLSYYLKVTRIKYGGGHFSLEDFMTAGHALAYFEESLKQSEYEISRKAHSHLTKVSEYVFSFDSDAFKKLLHIITIIEVSFSRINGSMYYLTNTIYSNIRKKEFKARISESYEIHQVKAVKKDIVIDGIPRPAYRAGWPRNENGIDWFTICKKDLGIDGVDADKPMDVYIQSHALIRLRERIDTVDHAGLHLTLATSLYQMEISNLPNGKSLLAYYHHDHKLGYFLLDVIDSVVVVRTFLFITNSGTPEGDRLDKELNVGKLEKQYVGIDKLSSFVTSDLMMDDRVKTIFDKIGLGYLKELDPKLYGSKDIRKKGFAADFIKYMNIDGRW